jgi:hypothetical protein
MIRKILLGGASCLAILGAAGEASAISFVDTTPGVSSFTAPTTGSYTISVWGAQGGAGYSGYTAGGGATFVGGLGYGQRESFHLTAGETVSLYVGAKGGDGGTGGIPSGGGGGGASAVLLYADAAGMISGGGGGGGSLGAGYNGQAVSFGGAGGAGGGPGGGPGGIAGSPGYYSMTGAPGGGLGTAGPGPYAGRGFFDGGAGGAGAAYGGAGGSGFAGGGGGFFGGGGGGGFSGGGGGNKYGGGGGGSYDVGGIGQTALAYKAGNGEIEISSSVPEPSTWAMMLGGFGFTGYVMRRRVTRRRVMRPA